MNNIEKKYVYQKAFEKWGEWLQLLMLFEEMAELQNAVCKVHRKKMTAWKSDVVEEMADVEIMIEQTMLIMGIGRNEVLDWKEKKLLRLKRRVEK